MRLEIFKNNSDIVEGRKQDTPETYFSCFCEIKELYGDELYNAQQVGWKNAVNFKVRYCKKIKEMYGSDYQSKFFIKFDGHKFEIKNMDFKNLKKDFVFIKCCMV